MNAQIALNGPRAHGLEGGRHLLRVGRIGTVKRLVPWWSPVVEWSLPRRGRMALRVNHCRRTAAQ
jgi:hypothetical protein